MLSRGRVLLAFVEAPSYLGMTDESLACPHKTICKATQICFNKSQSKGTDLYKA